MPVKWSSKTPNEVVLGGHSTSTLTVDEWSVSTIGAPWNASILIKGSASGVRRFRMRPAEMFNTHPMGRTSLRPVTMAGSLNSTVPGTFNSNGKPTIVPSEAWRTRQMPADTPPPPVMPPVHFGIDRMASPLVGTGPTQPSGMWNGCSLASWPLPARPGPSESSTKRHALRKFAGTPAWSGGLESLRMGDRWSRARSTMICVSGPTSSRWKPPVTRCCTAKMVDGTFSRGLRRHRLMDQKEGSLPI